MATIAHCLYCFESLRSELERRKQLSLTQVEDLWDKYLIAEEKQANLESGGQEEQEEDKQRQPDSHLSVPNGGRQRDLSTPSSASSSSMSVASSAQTRASSNTSFSSVSSLFGGASGRRRGGEEDKPMFVTWNTVHDSDGSKSLRGCIGTFEAQAIEKGLNTYALTSAFDDTRFAPIAAKELPTLECGVTLLTDFEPASEPMDWELGKHGIRISFNWNGRKYGATYLPDVPREQGWTKVETMVSLMRKAGWAGRRDDWERSVQDLKVIRYQGKKVAVGWNTFNDWREWCLEEGLIR